jgi:hypothetical protein
MYLGNNNKNASLAFIISMVIATYITYFFPQLTKGLLVQSTCLIKNKQNKVKY